MEYLRGAAVTGPVQGDFSLFFSPWPGFLVFAARGRGAAGPAPVADGSPSWTENEPSPGSSFGPLLPLSHPSLDQ